MELAVAFGELGLALVLLTSAARSVQAGLPRLLADAERTWLEEALRRYAKLTRAEVAAKLKISESALYKKLREHGITD